MSFGRNLQFLRKLHKNMTQEALAERLGVTRQTVSKWEQDAAFPEMDKAIQLCGLFSCSLDELIRSDISTDDPSYTNIRLEELPAFRYLRYTVVSPEPEDDALDHIRKVALSLGIQDPALIGWDFPFLSQEQISVFHLRGYAAACVLPANFPGCPEALTQPACAYAAITIREPMENPFAVIPNAYKTLMRFMEANGLQHREEKNLISCFEKTYVRDRTTYMDIYIAIAA